MGLVLKCYPWMNIRRNRLCKLTLRPPKEGHGESRILERRAWMSTNPVPAETSCSQRHFLLKHCCSLPTRQRSPLWGSAAPAALPIHFVVWSNPGWRRRLTPLTYLHPPAAVQWNPSGNDLTFHTLQVPIPSEWGFFSTHLGPALGIFLSPCICQWNTIN